MYDATPTAPSTQAECEVDCGGTWETSCPEYPPDCENGTFVRRQLAIFDPAERNWFCSAENGNLDTANGQSFTKDVAIKGFATIIIYGVTTTTNDKGVDAYISCNDRYGNAFEDNDGNATAVHTGDGAFVEDPDDAFVSIVE